MIHINRKSELLGAEKYGQCASCAKGSAEAELYQISFSGEGSAKARSIDLCWDCLIGMGSDIFDLYESKTPHGSLPKFIR